MGCSRARSILELGLGVFQGKVLGYIGFSWERGILRVKG